MAYPNNTAVWPPGTTFNESPADWMPAEWFAVCAGAVVNAFNLFALVVLNLNRSVRYVKILGIAHVNMIMLSSSVFWFTSLTSLRIIPQTGAFLVCSLWNVWLWIVPIVTLFVGFFARLWRLDVLLVQRRAPTFLAQHGPPALLWLPVIVICAHITAYSADGPWLVNGTRVLCNLKSLGIYFVYAQLIVVGFLTFVLSYRLRMVRLRIYSEYWAIFGSLLMFCIVLIIYAVVNQTGAQYLPWGRSFVAIVLLVATNVMCYGSFGAAVYNLLFRHDAASAEFADAVNNRCIVEDAADLTSLNPLEAYDPIVLVVNNVWLPLLRRVGLLAPATSDAAELKQSSSAAPADGF